VIIIMERGASEEQVENVIEKLVDLGFTIHRSTGAVHTVLGAVGPSEDFEPAEFEVLPGVKECHRVIAPYKLANRDFRPEGTVVRIGDVEIGGERIVVMAGPSSVENDGQLERTAEAVARAGAKFLRAGAYKQRKSPYVFQGLSENALKALRKAAERNGLLTVSEIVDASQAPLMEHAELRAARRAREEEAAGAAEARRGRDGGRVACVGGLHPVGRQLRRDRVRTRDPDVRNVDARHVRYQRDSHSEEAVAPADRR
jgi:hypothetical protein